MSLFLSLSNKALKIYIYKMSELLELKSAEANDVIDLLSPGNPATKDALQIEEVLHQQTEMRKMLSTLQDQMVAIGSLVQHKVLGSSFDDCDATSRGCDAKTPVPKVRLPPTPVVAAVKEVKLPQTPIVAAVEEVKLPQTSIVAAVEEVKLPQTSIVAAVEEVKVPPILNFEELHRSLCQDTTINPPIVPDMELVDGPATLFDAAEDYPVQIPQTVQ